MALGYILVIVSIGGCTGEPSPRLPDSDGWFGAGLPEWRAGMPHSMVGAHNLCIDRPGSIEIIDVVLEHSEGGLQVDAFATRALEPPIGTSYPGPVTFTETLWERGFVQGDTTVDTVCPDPDPEAEWTADLSADDSVSPAAANGPDKGHTGFGVQFSKPTDQTARGAILRVTYRSGGKTYVHRIGFELILCEGNHVEEEIPECDFRDMEEYGW